MGLPAEFHTWVDPLSRPILLDLGFGNPDPFRRLLQR